MASKRHGQLTPADGIHGVLSGSVATRAALQALAFGTSDVGKMLSVDADGSVHIVKPGVGGASPAPFELRDPAVVVSDTVAAATNGWRALFDLDFRTMAAQTLSTGNNTIGGLAWRTRMRATMTRCEIVPGEGLRMQRPAGSTYTYCNAPTSNAAPGITLDLSTVLGFDFSRPLMATISYEPKGVSVSTTLLTHARVTVGVYWGLNYRNRSTADNWEENSTPLSVFVGQGIERVFAGNQRLRSTNWYGLSGATAIEQDGDAFPTTHQLNSYGTDVNAIEYGWALVNQTTLYSLIGARDCDPTGLVCQLGADCGSSGLGSYGPGMHPRMLALILEHDDGPWDVAVHRIRLWQRDAAVGSSGSGGSVDLSGVQADISSLQTQVSTLATQAAPVPSLASSVAALSSQVAAIPGLASALDAKAPLLAWRWMGYGGAPVSFPSQGSEVIGVAGGIGGVPQTVILDPTAPAGTVVKVVKLTGSGFATVTWTEGGNNVSRRLVALNECVTWVRMQQGNAIQWLLLEVSSPSLTSGAVVEPTSSAVVDAGQVVIMDISGGNRFAMLSPYFSDHGECVIKVKGTPNGHVCTVDAGFYASAADRLIAGGSTPTQRTWALNTTNAYVRLKLRDKLFHVIGSG